MSFDHWLATEPPLDERDEEPQPTREDYLAEIEDAIDAACEQLDVVAVPVNWDVRSAVRVHVDTPDEEGITQAERNSCMLELSLDETIAMLRRILAEEPA